METCGACAGGEAAEFNPTLRPALDLTSSQLSQGRTGHAQSHCHYFTVRLALAFAPLLVANAQPLPGGERAPKSEVLTEPTLRWRVPADDPAVLCVAAAPEGDVIAAGGRDGNIRFCRFATADISEVLEGHTAPVYSLTYLPDGRRLVSAALDDTVVVWDLQRRIATHRLPWPAAKLYTCNLAVTPDGKIIACGAGPRIRLWDAESGEVLRTIQVEEHNVVSIAVSPDGSRLASGDGYANVHLWDVHSGSDLRRLDKPGTTVAYALHAPILATRDPAGMVYIWTEDAEPRRSIELTIGKRDSTSSFRGAIAISPDGGRLATVADEASIDLYDLTDGAILARIAAHTDRITALSFLPGGGLVSAGLDGSVYVWNVPDV
jgi:WD40 repeat protein